MVSGSGSASEGGLKGPKGIGGAVQSMKKGPWTAAEDAILMEYVRKHGEGNWNAVQKNSGLMRCGKSCRLRWANHLRPNLKKGSFSPEEEKIIIELHAKLGNKWARMAAQLPGRTDNEIKNYWNTRMKRRQRAGLPMYPQEIQEKAAAAFHLQHQHHHQHHQKRHQSNNSSPSLSSILASQNPAYNPSLSMFNTFNFSSAISPLQNQATSCYSNPNQQFQLLFDTNNNTNSLSLPLSPTPPYAPSSTSLLNQNIPTQTTPIPSFKFSSTGNNNFHHRDMSLSSMITGANSVDHQIDFVSGLATELPSSQIPPKQATLASSGSDGGVCAVGISNNANNNDYDQILNKTDSANSGLLDALVQESQKLSSNDKFKGDQSLSDAAGKGKSLADVSSMEEDGNDGVESMNMVNSGEANADNQWDDLSSSQSSIGMKASDQEPLEEMNSMDDDLMSLLNNFPLSMPLPEWYPGTNNTSNGSSSSMTGGNQDNNQRNISPAAAAPTAASQDHQWSLGSCRWKNMPSIC